MCSTVYYVMLWYSTLYYRHGEGYEDEQGVGQLQAGVHLRNLVLTKRTVHVCIYT